MSMYEYVCILYVYCMIFVHTDIWGHTVCIYIYIY